MSIRKLSPEEHIKTRKLYEEIFTGDSKAFVDFYYTEKIKDNQIYVVEEEEIRAMLHLNPYEMWIGDRKACVYYIVAVATGSAYRGRGYMASLLKQALVDRYHCGDAFTFLMAVNEGIYSRYDFRTVYKQEIRFYQPKEQLDTGVEVVPANESDCKTLADFVNSMLLEHYQVFVWRDETYYQRLLQEYQADGESVMIYKTGSSIVDCRLSGAPDQEGDGKIMIRILDVRKLLLCVSLKSMTKVCFCVSDPIILENNCCIQLSGTNHTGIELKEEEIRNSEGTISIAALAEVVFGAATVEEISTDAETVMTDRMMTELKKLVPLSRILLNEAG